MDKTLNRFVAEYLWSEKLEQKPPWQRAMFSGLRYAYVVVDDLARGELTLRAMSLVYTTLLSLVPLMAVSFSVLKAFGMHNKQLEPVLLRFLAPLGEQGTEITSNIIGFIDNVKIGVLGTFGIALLFYTAISLIQKVEGTFNYIWRLEQHRSVGRRFADYGSVMLIGPLLVFSAMGLTASMMNSSVMQSVMDIEPFGSILVLASRLLPLLLVIFAFTFAYVFVPNTRVNFASAFVGGVVGGSLWQGSGLVFAEFAAGSTKYAAIYSGFAILIMFMIWLYVSWLILLIGAQVAFYHQYPERIRLSDQRVALSGRFREQLTLLVIYQIARAFIGKAPPMTVDALSDALQAPPDRVAEAVELLANRDLLVETSSEPPEYLVVRDPSTVTVAQLLRSIRSPNEEQALMERRVVSAEPVDALLQGIDDAVSAQLGERTLRDCVLAGEQPAA